MPPEKRTPAGRFGGAGGGGGCRQPERRLGEAAAAAAGVRAAPDLGRRSRRCLPPASSSAVSSMCMAVPSGSWPNSSSRRQSTRIGAAWPAHGDHGGVDRRIVRAVVAVGPGALGVDHLDARRRQAAHAGEQHPQRIDALRVGPDRQLAALENRQPARRPHRAVRDVGAAVAGREAAAVRRLGAADRATGSSAPAAPSATWSRRARGRGRARRPSRAVCSAAPSGRVRGRLARGEEGDELGLAQDLDRCAGRRMTDRRLVEARELRRGTPVGAARAHAACRAG